MNYQQTIEFLYNRLPVFHRIGSAAYKPGLDNTIKLLSELKNPHNSFKSIHVAGTNGKGSVSNFLAAIFQQAGYKTGLYTSPHLVDFGERIRIDGKMIDENYVIEFIESNMPAIEKIQPSFFELTMSMAFNYFADNQVDIAIIEVGLGGRLDSTNIITPELSVITNIDYDHVEFLGNTLEKIAFEKAGIIKPGIPVVIGEYLPETKPVFIEKAKNENSELFFAEDISKTIYLENENSKLKFQNNEEIFISELSGQYQLKNLNTVLTAIKIINKKNIFNISSQAIHSGIENCCKITGLRGRWEKISSNPDIIVDTGHNEAGIRAVIQMISSQKFENLHIIIGMVNDKDTDSILKHFPDNAEYYFTNAQSARSLSANTLKNKAESYKLEGKVFNTVNDAILSAKSKAKENDLIIITGSNYVAGEALECLNDLFEPLN
jgi:dihydrofolate synthase/folylpolyglutamate synthase